MNLDATLSKTPKGMEEVETRKYRLETRLRSLLIMVNGKETAGELVQKFAQVRDVTPALEKLLAEGFIAEAADAPAAPGKAPGGASFEKTRAQLSNALSDALGPAADAICVKLEECRSAAELREFLASRKAVLDSGLGPRSAAFWAKARELLS
jgi:hypothetical protein